MGIDMSISCVECVDNDNTSHDSFSETYEDTPNILRQPHSYENNQNILTRKSVNDDARNHDGMSSENHGHDRIISTSQANATHCENSESRINQLEVSPQVAIPESETNETSSLSSSTDSKFENNEDSPLSFSPVEPELIETKDDTAISLEILPSTVSEIHEDTSLNLCSIEVLDKEPIIQVETAHLIEDPSLHHDNIVADQVEDGFHGTSLTNFEIHPSLQHALSSLSRNSSDDCITPLPFSPKKSHFEDDLDDLSVISSHSHHSNHSRSTTRSTSSSHSKKLITCDQCHQTLPKHSFSSLQLKKKIHRVCKMCTNGDVYVL